MGQAGALVWCPRSSPNTSGIAFRGSPPRPEDDIERYAIRLIPESRSYTFPVDDRFVILSMIAEAFC